MKPKVPGPGPGPGPLLGLPAEIRAMILHHLLVPISHHMLFSIGRQIDACLCLQILCTCRQLLKEGLPLLYGQSVIEADFPGNNCAPMFGCIDQSCIRMMRKLSLPADNDIDDIEEDRDLVQGAQNINLAALFQDHSTKLNGLQMLRLEFETSDPPPDEDDPYFRHLKLWDEFERPKTTEDRRNELCNLALDFAFRWTVLRAFQAVSQNIPQLGSHVYEFVDRSGESHWIVFTKCPLVSSEEASFEVGIDRGSVSNGNIAQPCYSL